VAGFQRWRTFCDREGTGPYGLRRSTRSGRWAIAVSHQAACRAATRTGPRAPGQSIAPARRSFRLTIAGFFGRVWRTVRIEVAAGMSFFCDIKEGRVMAVVCTPGKMHGGDPRSAVERRCLTERLQMMHRHRGPRRSAELEVIRHILNGPL